ncbi:MAG: ABC transporter ATP-binding protein [Candidatus Diapherotrites archaeon]|nr:ABC transporter ATP-binding protein [Candidatus Diapherotrites archaeon]
MGGKPILRDLNLSIPKAKTHALIGPNGSGKSTLAYTIMGIPKYKITHGKILFNKKDVSLLPPEKRAKLGIAMTFQNPPEVKGVTLSEFMKRISKGTFDYDDPIISRLMQRELNVGFSGGEKKISEIIQVFSLKPKLVIFDEIDSGLDINKLDRVVQLMREELEKTHASALVITHRPEILSKMKPDMTHVMLDGKIVCTSKNWRKVWDTVRRHSYEKCKECKLSIHKS